MNAKPMAGWRCGRAAGDRPRADLQPRVWRAAGRLGLALLCFPALAGCGYRLTTAAPALPRHIRVIAVPPFVNNTRIPRLSQMMTAAVVRELIARTHAAVSAQISGSDAVLRASLLRTQTTPVTFDPTTGRATTIQVQLELSASFTDERTGKPLFNDRNIVFHDQYQVGEPTASFIEEDQLAFRRMSTQVARDLVARILNRF